MTERQGEDVVEVLRSRLGARYPAGLDEGRREINRVVAEELRIDRDEAERMVGRLLDAGAIRYVTGAESDPVDEPRLTDDDTSRLDSQRVNAIPGQGGPPGGMAGQMGGAVAPVAAGGTGAAIPGHLAVAASSDAPDAPGGGGGYWDFRGDRAGVVPSRSRKGQVEPRGI